jgi:hypothetical protein
MKTAPAPTRTTIASTKPPEKYTGWVSFKKEISIADFINLAIAFIAVLTLRLQLNFNRRSLEFAYQPNFSFKQFPDYNQESTVWTPRLCMGSYDPALHPCKDDHWFSMDNTSDHPALEVKVFMFHKNEFPKGKKFSLKDVSNRKCTTSLLSPSHTLEYALPQKTVPTELYETRTSYFYALVIFRTINERNRFMQVYKLSCQPLKKVGTIDDWKDNLRFYHVVSKGFKKLSPIMPNYTINKFMRSIIKTELKFDHERRTHTQNA